MKELKPVGLFYSNLTVASDNRQLLLLHMILNNDKRSDYFIGPVQNGRVVVFDKLMDEQKVDAITTLGCSVTKLLKCPALAAALHDDDVLLLWLFEQGKVTDYYDSLPGYFDRSSARLPPEGGNAERLCAAFGRPERVTQVEKLLRADLLEGEMPEIRGEQERHVAIAAELGLPPYVARLGYYAIANGFVPEEYRDIAFHPPKKQAVTSSAPVASPVLLSPDRPATS